jgi:hypothetical protein
MFSKSVCALARQTGDLPNAAGLGAKKRHAPCLRLGARVRAAKAGK